MSNNDAEKHLKPTQSNLDLYEDFVEEMESKTGEDFIDHTGKRSQPDLKVEVGMTKSKSELEFEINSPKEGRNNLMSEMVDEAFNKNEKKE
eukprot:gene5165-8771_t